MIAASQLSNQAFDSSQDISFVGFKRLTVACLREFCACDAGRPLVVNAAVAAENSSRDIHADAMTGADAPNACDICDISVLPNFTVLNSMSATLDASHASYQKAFSDDVIISVACSVLDNQATASSVEFFKTFKTSAVSETQAETIEYADAQRSSAVFGIDFVISSIHFDRSFTAFVLSQLIKVDIFDIRVSNFHAISIAFHHATTIVVNAAAQPTAIAVNVLLFLSEKSVILSQSDCISFDHSCDILLTDFQTQSKTFDASSIALIINLTSHPPQSISYCYD